MVVEHCIAAAMPTYKAAFDLLNLAKDRVRIFILEFLFHYTMVQKNWQHDLNDPKTAPLRENLRSSLDPYNVLKA